MKLNKPCTQKKYVIKVLKTETSPHDFFVRISVTKYLNTCLQHFKKCKKTRIKLFVI